MNDSSVYEASLICCTYILISNQLRQQSSPQTQTGPNSAPWIGSPSKGRSPGYRLPLRLTEGQSEHFPWLTIDHAAVKLLNNSSEGEMTLFSLQRNLVQIRQNSRIPHHPRNKRCQSIGSQIRINDTITAACYHHIIGAGWVGSRRP